MARTSALGYLLGKKQSALGTPATMSSGATFFRAISAPEASPVITNTPYRETGGGRSPSLLLKEGIAYNLNFPSLARPCPSGFLVQAASGPGSATGAYGGGNVANGLYEPPKAAGGGGSSTLTALAAAGATTLNVVSSTNFASGDLVAIGWGPTLEFVTLAADPPGGTSLTVPATKYPHTYGEPVFEVVAYTTLTTAAAEGTAALDFTTTGFTTGDFIAIGPDSDTTYLGAEYGQVEVVTLTLPAKTTTARAHKHSAGSWIYVVRATGETNTTNRIHGFEPMTALDATLNYYTWQRGVPGATALYENIQDCKLGGLTLSGESPKALQWQANWAGRFGTVPSAGETEVYTNQDPVADLPFRMSNGKFYIGFNTSTGLSTRLRQFSVNFGNIMAQDIFTDDIVSDDILDLALEGGFSAQFYYETRDEYLQWLYGTTSPGTTDRPTTSIVSGEVVLNFSIASGKRMMIYIPQMVWGNFPVNIDPEPKPLIVEATGSPQKPTGRPIWSIGIDNKDLTVY